MKGKKLSLLLIMLLLAVGFAAVTTNLILNGNTKIGMGDFDVFFSEADAENENDSIEISEDKHSLNFVTRLLSMASVDEQDESVFTYQITNNSADYDADVKLRLNISSTIDYAEYISTVMLFENDGSSVEIIDGSTVTIPAKSSKNGQITIKLLKPITEDATIQLGLNMTAVATSIVSPISPGMADVLMYSSLDAGLYDTNMNMIKTWDELKEEETIYVSDDGELYSNFNEDAYFYTDPTGGEKQCTEVTRGGGIRSFVGSSDDDECINASPKITKISNMLQEILGGLASNWNIIDYDNILAENTSCANLNGVLVIDTEVNSTRELNFSCPGLKAVIFKRVDSNTRKNNERGFAGIKVFNGMTNNYTITGYNTGYYFSAANAKIDGDWAYDADDPTRIVAYLGDDKNIVIPEGTTEISGPAFAYLNFDSITYPESLTKLGDGAFNHIQKDSLVIPGTVKEIGSFIANDSLYSSLELGDGIQKIGENAFTYNGLVKTITVPDSVTSIGIDAFKKIHCLYYHGSLESEAEGYKYWGADFFNPYINGDFIYYDEGLTILEGYEGNGGDIVIPDGVVSIIDSPFYNVPLTSLTLPDTLTEIPGRPFYGSKLQYLEVPSSVTTIGQDSFSGVFIVKYHGSATFNEYTNWGARYLNCDNINGFIVTEDGKELINYINPYTDNITRDITVPVGVERIHENAISNNYYIRNINLPDSIKYIEFHAIYKTSTDEVVVPSTVETVENDAFPNVINVIYNGSLSTDKWGVLCKNGYIEDLYVYENINKKKLISSTFLNDKDTKNINLAIPEGVEEIGEKAFYTAYNTSIHFVSLSLPSTLKIIGNLAFYNTGIESDIIIPDGVTSIGRSSFAYHNSHYIYIPASVTIIDSLAFKRPFVSSGDNSGDVVFEDHSKWELYRYSAYNGGETLYHEGDYFNDTQTVYNDLVHYRYDYSWSRS